MTALLAMTVDPWILTFSLITVAATIGMGFWSAKKSKTASDFFVAGRSVSVGWNASAISGEYLSAASFMGIAGMVMKNGYDALWYPVCYACGYLFLLLFIAGPLRRFGAYTIPDFAEGRYNSPVFRKIAVIFVLFIGFFYTMPQMKGAGTTLAYIFPGLDYRVGVILVGAVITLNVSLGGMKGITLVQAIQYWIKMFAIAVPIFVLMSVYGFYGEQLRLNGEAQSRISNSSFKWEERKPVPDLANSSVGTGKGVDAVKTWLWRLSYRAFNQRPDNTTVSAAAVMPCSVEGFLSDCAGITGEHYFISADLEAASILFGNATPLKGSAWVAVFEGALKTNGVSVYRQKERDFATIHCAIIREHGRIVRVFPENRTSIYLAEKSNGGSAPGGSSANAEVKWLDDSGPKTTNFIPVSTSMSMTAINGWVRLDPPGLVDKVEERVESFFGRSQTYYMVSDAKLVSVLFDYAHFIGRPLMAHTNINLVPMLGPYTLNRTNWSGTLAQIESFLASKNLEVITDNHGMLRVVTPEMADEWKASRATQARKPLPAKAPADDEWLSPFGPLTTKAAKTANASPRWNISSELRASLVDWVGMKPPTGIETLENQMGDFVQKLLPHKPAPQPTSWLLDWTNVPPNTSYGADFRMLDALTELGKLSGRPVFVATNIPRPSVHVTASPGSFRSAEDIAKYLENSLLTNGVRLDMNAHTIKVLPAADWERYRQQPASFGFETNQAFSMYITNNLPKLLVYYYGKSVGKSVLIAPNFPTQAPEFNPKFEALLPSEVASGLEKIFAEVGITIIPAGHDEIWAVPTSDVARYKLPPVNVRPLSLLYTYSLIIALVCGTAGLPHILVRFYTNPDGVAAKRTTMWVMILIGVFYVFPPVFGVLGRNLLPELYSAVGAKGTDKVVLELPSLLNQKFPGLGSVLSGITCAGAFAAFMSTFSGLLVSMTGALAHDVYGRILRPGSTPQQRLRAFKICAVIIGVVAILLGMQVEKLDINFMVGQAFAIAAASYFPLLFLSIWWRGLTMKGAACGMLGGGLLALGGISLTSFSDLKLIHLDELWAAHPLARILCEQPAIWAVPLAIGLMIVVSKLTHREAPADVRMKMLVLHAPEKLGLKQEYIQEHLGH